MVQLKVTGRKPQLIFFLKSLIYSKLQSQGSHELYKLSDSFEPARKTDIWPVLDGRVLIATANYTAQFWRS